MNIKSSNNQLSWSDIKAESSWQIFKVMSELVEGFEKLNKIGPCISIFGSARSKPENPYYKLEVEIGEALVKEGFGVITGGGPGIMEAANKGAKEGGGASVGLNIELPFEGVLHAMNGLMPNVLVDENFIVDPENPIDMIDGDIPFTMCSWPLIISNLNVIEFPNNKSLIKTIDILGRDTNSKGFNIEIYNDGSVEKKYLIK